MQFWIHYKATLMRDRATSVPYDTIFGTTLMRDRAMLVPVRATLVPYDTTLVPYRPTSNPHRATLMRVRATVDVRQSNFGIEREILLPRAILVPTS
jgi:hypothetical protein